MKLHLMIIDPEWDFCWPGLGHFMDLNSAGWKKAIASEVRDGPRISGGSTGPPTRTQEEGEDFEV